MDCWQDLVRLQAEEIMCAHMSSCLRLLFSENYWKFSLVILNLGVFLECGPKIWLRPWADITCTLK